MKNNKIKFQIPPIRPDLYEFVVGNYMFAVSGGVYDMQFRNENCIINWKHGPNSCLIVNKNGDVVDGFVIFDTRTNLYRGKTFEYWLEELHNSKID